MQCMSFKVLIGPRVNQMLGKFSEKEGLLFVMGKCSSAKKGVTMKEGETVRDRGDEEGERQGPHMALMGQ